MVIENQEPPATKKQLWRLHELLNVDTRNWNINKQQAWDMIESLEMDIAVEQSQELYIPDNAVPFSESMVTLIEGDQRSGKSCTAVAKVVDDYHMDAVKNYMQEIWGIECKVKSYDLINRIARIVIDGQIQEIDIPKDYKLHSNLRIFSNIHLFGIPYVWIPTFRHLLKWLRNGFITNGWLIIDEAHVGMNAREAIGKLQKELSKQSFQFAKAMLKVIIISHMSRLLDFRIRGMPTERLYCTFNPKTWEITYTKRKKGDKNESSVTYYAPMYYPYYWTNERINQ